MTRARLIVLFFAGALLSGKLAAASEQSELLYSRGLVEFHAERYPQALELFDQAVQADAEDIYALYYRGVTRARVQDLKGAVMDLWTVIRRKPDLSQAELELGVALVELGSNRDAVGWLESAQHHPELEAPASLFLGIAQVRLGETQAADANLARAAQEDPSLQLASHYYRGVAAYQMKDRKAAQEHVQYVATTSPDSEMGRDAAEFLTKIRQGAGPAAAARPYELHGSVGLQYDSNVAIAPNNETLKSTAGISKQDDGRAVIQAGGNYTAWQNQNAMFSVGYDFFQSLHFDLTEFNLQDHQPHAQFVYTAGRLQFGLFGSYDFYLLDTSSFMQEGTGLPWVRVDEGAFGRTDLFYRVRRRDFIESPFSGVNDDFTHSAGMRQFFYLGAPDRYLSLGYRFDRTDPINSQGTLFAYDGNEVSAGLSWLLPADVTTETGFTYRHEQYVQPSKGPLRNLPQRYDDVYGIIAELRKPLTERLALVGGYYGTFNDSNQGKYEFQRHIGSVSLEMRY